jgi:hypothetical protein
METKHKAALLMARTDEGFFDVGVRPPRVFPTITCECGTEVTLTKHACGRCYECGHRFDEDREWQRHGILEADYDVAVKARDDLVVQEIKGVAELNAEDELEVRRLLGASYNRLDLRLNVNNILEALLARDQKT